MKYFIIAIMVIVSGCAKNYSFKHEKDYQKFWCEERGGKIEYQLNDGTRVDCLLSGYAVEVDWDYKWAEGVGQAQYYALKTKRHPGLLLIKSKDGDRFVLRAKIAGNYSDLKVWTIDK